MVDFLTLRKSTVSFALGYKLTPLPGLMFITYEARKMGDDTQVCGAPHPAFLSKKFDSTFFAYQRHLLTPKSPAPPCFPGDVG